LRDLKKRNQLCACLYTIWDSEVAISPYKKTKKVTYLEIYGILQTLFVQQDAVSNLSFSVFGSSIEFKCDYSKLYEIRERRNDIIGHPTNRRNWESFHIIHRNSISPEWFEYVSYLEDETPIRYMDIRNALKVQSEYLLIILKNMKKKLEKEQKVHKLKFKKNKLASLSKIYHYHLGKLIDGVYSWYPLATQSLESLIGSYKKIKEGIVARYDDINALPWIENSVNKLDFLFSKISSYFDGSWICEQIEIYIFVEALGDELKLMEDMLKEIDEDFS